MQESPHSNRETIETHSLLSQTSVKPLQSPAQHIQKKTHTKEANIHEHNVNTEKPTPNHEIESKTLFY
jgi:hypothetical protein